MKKIFTLFMTFLFLVGCSSGTPTLDGTYEDGRDAIAINGDQAEIYFGENDFYMTANIYYNEANKVYGFVNANIDNQYPDEYILFGQVFAENVVFEPVIQRNQVVAIDILAPEEAPVRMEKQ